MTILITNDDGVFCGGIYALFQALSKEHEVYCIAPLKNKSGSSSAINIDTRIYYKRFADNIFGAACFPADCVSLGFIDLIPKKPELVISGINRGPNYGCDVQYSGTVGAAIQAGRFSVPGIAVSLCEHEAPLYFEETARFVAEHLQDFLTLIRPGSFLNINTPNKPKLDSYTIACATKSEYSVWAKSNFGHSIIKDSSLSDEYEQKSDRFVVDSGEVAVSILSNVVLEEYAKN